MKKLVALLVVTLVAGSKSVQSRDRIQIQVTPSVASAPGFVKVRVFVEQDVDNRAVEIVADSGDFYRSSLIAIDGDRAPRATEMVLRELPGGEYDVAAVLLGIDGVRAVAHRAVVIVSAAGLR